MESTEQEVDDEDFYQDTAEVTDFVNAHRGQEGLPEGRAGSGGECVVPCVYSMLKSHVSSDAWMPHAFC